MIVHQISGLFCHFGMLGAARRSRSHFLWNPEANDEVFCVCFSPKLFHDLLLAEDHDDRECQVPRHVKKKLCTSVQGLFSSSDSFTCAGSVTRAEANQEKINIAEETPELQQTFGHHNKTEERRQNSKRHFARTITRRRRKNSKSQEGRVSEIPT